MMTGGANGNRARRSASCRHGIACLMASFFALIPYSLSLSFFFLSARGCACRSVACFIFFIPIFVVAATRKNITKRKDRVFRDETKVYPNILRFSPFRNGFPLSLRFVQTLLELPLPRK